MPKQADTTGSLFLAQFRQSGGPLIWKFEALQKIKRADAEELCDVLGHSITEEEKNVLLGGDPEGAARMAAVRMKGDSPGEAAWTVAAEWFFGWMPRKVRRGLLIALSVTLFGIYLYFYIYFIATAATIQQSIEVAFRGSILFVLPVAFFFWRRWQRGIEPPEVNTGAYGVSLRTTMKWALAISACVAVVFAIAMVVLSIANMGAWVLLIAPLAGLMPFFLLIMTFFVGVSFKANLPLLRDRHSSLNGLILNLLFWPLATTLIVAYELTIIGDSDLKTIFATGICCGIPIGLLIGATNRDWQAAFGSKTKNAQEKLDLDVPDT